MIKIPLMTSGPSRTGSTFVGHDGDRLEPTRALSPRNDNPTLPFSLLRPGYPAPMVLRRRPQDLPHVA